MTPLLDAAGRVVNVIALPAGTKYQPPQGLKIGPPGGQIGDIWDGSKYIQGERAAKIRRAPPADATALAQQVQQLTEELDLVKRHALVAANIREA